MPTVNPIVHDKAPKPITALTSTMAPIRNKGIANPVPINSLRTILNSLSSFDKANAAKKREMHCKKYDAINAKKAELRL